MAENNGANNNENTVLYADAQVGHIDAQCSGQCMLPRPRHPQYCLHGRSPPAQVTIGIMGIGQSNDVINGSRFNDKPRNHRRNSIKPV